MRIMIEQQNRWSRVGWRRPKRYIGDEEAEKDQEEVEEEDRVRAKKVNG